MGYLDWARGGSGREVAKPSIANSQADYRQKNYRQVYSRFTGGFTGRL
jgi:hypothetical protein